MKAKADNPKNSSLRGLFYRRALERLPAEERERERKRDIPYEFSLSAVSSFFFETGRRQGWIAEDGAPVKKPLLLAVSGGSDSMALLWLFRVFFGGELAVAHFEHGIRGGESEEDALFVEEAAGRWGIETVICHGDVPGSLKKGESTETGARRLRYAFFQRLADERGAYGVALGHNREDVAETTLFNLLRGSGVRGLAGMPERRGIFFRPLLTCSREFLRGLLRHRGITWREDRTNKDEAYTRNFIRNRLIPAIESGVNAGATDHLVAFAEEMRYYREEEERQGDLLIKTAVAVFGELGELCAGGGWVFERAAVSSMSLRERAVLIREAGRRLGLPVLPRERCLELARLMEGKGRLKFEFQWGGGLCVLGDGDRIKFGESGK